MAKKRTSLIIFVTMMLFLPIYTSGCNPSFKTTEANTTTDSTTEIVQQIPYFPMQKEMPLEFMLVSLTGKLVNDKGYLRVADALIIWPYGYSLEVSGAELWIISDKGQTVAKVGDIVKLGGGFLDSSAVEARIGQSLPSDAAGPYFISNPQ
jgi:hypothetical protein